MISRIIRKIKRVIKKWLLRKLGAVPIVESVTPVTPVLTEQPVCYIEETYEIECPICGIQRTHRVICGNRHIQREHRFDEFRLIRAKLYKCDRCHMMYFWPRPSVEELNLHYQNAFQKEGFESENDFDKKLSPTDLEYRSDILSFVREHMSGNDFNGDIIEVGCGSGTLLREAFRFGSKPIGVKPDQRLSGFISSRLNINMFNCGLLDLPDSEYGKYSIIFMINNLEHHEKLRETLAKLFNLLKTGGSLFIEVPNVRSLTATHNLDNYRYLIFPDHLNYWDQESAEYAMRLAGFEIKSAVSVTPLWEAVYVEDVARSRGETLYHLNFLDTLTKEGKNEVLWIIARKPDSISTIKTGLISRDDLHKEMNHNEASLLTEKSGLSVFANFRINDENRFKVMIESFQSFKDCGAKEWVINIRGAWRKQAGEWLGDELGVRLKLFELETKEPNPQGKLWFVDSRIMLKEVTGSYIFFWVEDHIRINKSITFSELLSEANKGGIQVIYYSWKNFYTNYNGQFDDIVKERGIFLDKVVIDSGTNQIMQSKFKKIGWYIIPAQAMFNYETFYRLITSDHPLPNRCPAYTPFDFEKRADDEVWLPLLVGFPRQEIFACLDDDACFPGSSLVSRGLYTHLASSGRNGPQPETW